jgi:hypothetical protein
MTNLLLFILAIALVVNNAKEKDSIEDFDHILTRNKVSVIINLHIKPYYTSVYRFLDCFSFYHLDTNGLNVIEKSNEETSTKRCYNF